MPTKMTDDKALAFANAARTLIVINRARRHFKSNSKHSDEVEHKPRAPKNQPPVRNPSPPSEPLLINFTYSTAVEKAAENYRYDRGIPAVDDVVITDGRAICRNVIRRWAKECARIKLEPMEEQTTKKCRK